MIVTSVVLSAALVTSSAMADTLSAGGNSVGSITRISKGVKELSLEMNVVFKSDTVKGKEGAPDTTNSQLALVGAPVFRYFLIDNLALGLHVGGFYKSASSKSGDIENKTTDTGFLGTLTAAYYAGLGGGMFIAPMVGGGGFFGNREISSPGPTAGGPLVVNRATLSGAAVRAGLGFVFYSSARFNLFARPEAIIYLGSSKPKEEANTTPTTTDTSSTGFTSIDGGFTCGFSYIF